MTGAPVKKRRKKYVNLIELVVMYAILALLAFVYLVPFLMLVFSSLKTSPELYQVAESNSFRDVVKSWLPAVPQWHNYPDMFRSFPFFHYLRNTMILVVSCMAGALISNSLVAYSFARIPWKGRNICFVLVLMTMMLPFQVIMIPLFIFFQRLGWVGTFAPLIVPSFFGNAFFIFLLRQFFIGIPFEITESAKIDGANEFEIFYRLILPLARPALATVMIFAFLNTWNDFIGPLVFIASEKLYTLSIGVQQIMSQNDPRWILLMAIGVVMTLPVLVIFFLLQKYFIQGIAFSGIKG